MSVFRVPDLSQFFYRYFEFNNLCTCEPNMKVKRIPTLKGNLLLSAALYSHFYLSHFVLKIGLLAKKSICNSSLFELQYKRILLLNWQRHNTGYPWQKVPPSCAAPRRGLVRKLRPWVQIFTDFITFYLL